MNAVALRKDEFVGTEAEVMEGGAALLPQTAPETTVEVAAKPEKALPFGIKIPLGRAALDALWPPLAGIGGFLALWALLAPLVQTSLGTLPGPGDVWSAFGGLLDEAAASRVAAAEAVAAGYAYTGPPTFIDQIFTSLETVAAGFVLATMFAVPLGLVAGMSKRVNAAINPLVQVMRPVSPLAPSRGW